MPKRKKPRAVVWYDVYCHLFALLNFWTAWHAFQAIREPERVVYGVGFIAEQATDEYMIEFWLFAVSVASGCFLVTGLVFGIAALALPHTPPNKRTWTAHIVHLAFGASSLILAPVCVPVLVAWFNPEVKAYFGVEPRPSEGVNSDP